MIRVKVETGDSVTVHSPLTGITQGPYQVADVEPGWVLIDERVQGLPGKLATIPIEWVTTVHKRLRL